MFHKIKDVKALDNYKLLITFQNNEEKYYDLLPLIDKYSHFRDLITIKGLYKQVKVDVGGYGISWNDNIDISCNELYSTAYYIKII